MRLTIDVTAEDIKKGRPCSAGHCPIALAVRRAAASEDVGVIPERVRIGVIFARPPDEAVRFIEDFDCKAPVEPFSFTLSDEE